MSNMKAMEINPERTAIMDDDIDTTYGNGCGDDDIAVGFNC